MNTICHPTLVLDEQKVIDNITLMRDKAARQSLQFRPHFKTHQCASIATVFKNLGIHKATVSSLPMAIYFYRNGWKDLTVAIPHNPRETPLLDVFSRESMPSLLLDNVDTLEHLQRQSKHPLEIWIKIDTGYHRCGIPWDKEKHLASLAKKIRSSSKLKLMGVLTHAGHSYYAQDKESVQAIHEQQTDRICHARALLHNYGFDKLLVSVGDTPCCRLAETFNGIDEIRPGNFVFYDLDQFFRTVCRFNEIAMIVACPIVGVYPERKQVVIHGGSVHLGRDFRINTKPEHCFGLPVLLDPKGWSKPLDASVVSLSQEHGIVTFRGAMDRTLKIGGILGILPVHSCLTADLHHHYMTSAGGRLSKRRSCDRAACP